MNLEMFVVYIQINSLKQSSEVQRGTQVQVILCQTENSWCGQTPEITLELSLIPVNRSKGKTSR